MKTGTELMMDYGPTRLEAAKECGCPNVDGYLKMVAENVDLHEQMAVLQSKEVCTKPHDDDVIEGCQYCRIERLSAEVRGAFFAGCDFGSKYAGDQYLGTPERQRGFDKWKRDDETQV